MAGERERGPRFGLDDSGRLDLVIGATIAVALHLHGVAGAERYDAIQVFTGVNALVERHGGVGKVGGGPADDDARRLAVESVVPVVNRLVITVAHVGLETPNDHAF